MKTLFKFLKNIYIFRKFLWEYRWYDYESLIKVNHYILEDMIDKTERYGIHIDKPNTIKNMKYLSILFKNILNNNKDYFNYYGITGVVKDHIPFSKNYLLKKYNNDTENIKFAYQRLTRVIETFWD